MKVLFVYPVPPSRYQILRYQQGIGYLSAILKKAGHETRLLTISAMEPDLLSATLDSFHPQLVAISLTSGFMDLTREIAGWVAANHQIPVLLGGVHPTVCPEESIAAEGVFAICRGEGEYPLLELCEAMQHGRDPSGIANLWVNLGGQVHRNEVRPLITDLDALPYPDRELFDFSGMMRHFSEA